MKEMKESSSEVISLISDDEASPLRPIFVLKTRNDTKPFDDNYDCFILDFNPDDPINGCINDLSLSCDEDVAVISEKGQVACRDYPHSRHLCAEHPFDKTPHESFCKLCYCYVCDTAAPCKFWKGPNLPHCDATDQSDTWKSLRRLQVKPPFV